MIQSTDKELAVLENIYATKEPVRQRDLASVVGLSLGMTNAIIKRLAQKGFITIRKVNNRNISYAVSPEGAEAIAKRSYRYLRRTIRNVVDYKQAVEELTAKVKRAGYTGILLAGKSDVDFMLEHFCTKYGLSFRKEQADKQKEPAPRTGEFILMSENVIPPPAAEDDLAAGKAFLAGILLGL